MSVWMQYAPYDLRQGNWHGQREVLGDTVVNLIEEYAPGFKDSILHRQVLTPLDLERVFGLTGGNIYHAEMALDQIFFLRPLPGWAGYCTPVRIFISAVPARIQAAASPASPATTPRGRF